LTPEDLLVLAMNRRLMRLPLDPCCAQCGEWRLLALSPPGPGRPVLCFECLACLQGRPALEVHHLGGRPSPLPTVPVPLNQHAVLTLLQDLWWRGRQEPGAPYAVGFDLGALVAVRLAWAPTA
jgi:hypothetical protein